MKKNTNTLCATTARHSDAIQMANPPMYQGSTIIYERMADLAAAHHAYENGQESYTYGRKGTPTSRMLCEALTELEGGHRAYLCPSGLAALSTALLSQLSSGDHVLMVDTVYSPTRDLCEHVLKRLGVSTTYYNPFLGKDIADLIQPNTRVIFLESPGSLTLEIQDVPAITAVAKAHNIVTILDNTWATPLYFKAFEHGVDIVVQAVTKYLGGHSDVLMGAVIANQAAYKSVRNTAHQTGQFAGGMDISLVLRGLRTLPTRLREHERNALQIAQWFETQDAVDYVRHPALPSHPQHALWQRDFLGSTGLFTVAFKPEYSAAQINAMVESYDLFGIGYSWGGFESLALPVHPSHLAHVRSVTPVTQQSMVRYQIGLEGVDDLIADLQAGLSILG
ncbi:MAG: cystathionine beta-lyase [Burkholderiaceae bacterium]|nr:cystathionine beta-lyase [Burkholderiaceae bacterium]